MKLFNKSKEPERNPYVELRMNVSVQTQFFWTNVQALKQLITKLESELLSRVENLITPEALLWLKIRDYGLRDGVASAIDNAKGSMQFFSQHEAADLTRAKILLGILESSPEYKAASALIEPLLAEIAEFEHSRSEAAANARKAADEVLRLEEEVHAKARAEIESNPEIVQARSGLEAAMAVAAAESKKCEV